MAGAGRKVKVEKTALLYYYLVNNRKFCRFRKCRFHICIFCSLKGEKNAI